MNVQWYYAVDSRDTPEDAWSWTGSTYTTEALAKDKIKKLKLLYPTQLFRIDRIPV